MWHVLGTRFLDMPIIEDLLQEMANEKGIGITRDWMKHADYWIGQLEQWDSLENRLTVHLQNMPREEGNAAYARWQAYKINYAPKGKS